VAFTALVAATFAGVLVLPLFGLPVAVLLGAAGAVPAVAAARRLRSSPDVTPRLVPAQAWTLLAFLLLATGSGLGLLVG
jgi:hypothetical protein